MRRISIRRLSPTRRLGLRARITLAFAVGALLLSALLSATTWALTRENLLNQEDSAMLLVFQNAGTVQNRVNRDTDQQALHPAGVRMACISCFEYWSAYAISNAGNANEAIATPE